MIFTLDERKTKNWLTDKLSLKTCFEKIGEIWKALKVVINFGSGKSYVNFTKNGTLSIEWE